MPAVGEARCSPCSHGVRAGAQRSGGDNRGLVIVGITALVAAVGHARSGNVQRRRGCCSRAPGVPASLAGTALNRLVEENVLLLVVTSVSPSAGWSRRGGR